MHVVGIAATLLLRGPGGVGRLLLLSPDGGDETGGERGRPGVQGGGLADEGALHGQEDGAVDRGVGVGLLRVARDAVSARVEFVVVGVVVVVLARLEVRQLVSGPAGVRQGPLQGARVQQAYVGHDAKEEVAEWSKFLTELVKLQVEDDVEIESGVGKFRD